jgi:hypothetical protein
MADGGTGSPRIRMPRIKLPTRRGSGAAAETQEATATKTKPLGAASERPTEPKADAKAPPTPKESAKQPATEETATKDAAKSETPEPNLQERIAGLQGWMAELERKQARLTYFGIAALTVAILASIAALYFGLAARNDKAPKDDVDTLTKKVDALQSAATKNSKATQNALNASAAQLQASIAALQKQQAQNAASISTLQSQATAGAFSKGAGAAQGAALTPGAATPTTPKKP